MSPPSPSVWEEETEDEDNEIDDFGSYNNPISTPFISPGFKDGGENGGGRGRGGGGQFPILDFVLAALRKSLVTCSVEREDVSTLDISCPTDVRHVSHVTFDPFNGFLGLPVDLQPEVPRRVPSASASVFSVSPQSMQCSIDERGNSVPTILIMMQKRLYQGGGLQAEGIFRINGENSQEECVRNQLNKGVIPKGIDVHCLAGLIKAWFRELPKGVLDSLSPEQVMHCNTEDECSQLVKLLPPIEAALLDWAINLMADVVQNEQYNKMNARNIAMVFAPNMTQMADPLTALIHAVQVMNFLKTLIVRTLRLREESAVEARMLSSFADSMNTSTNPHRSSIGDLIFEEKHHTLSDKSHSSTKLRRSVTFDRLDFSPKKKQGMFQKEYDEEGKEYGCFSGGSSPVTSLGLESKHEGERILDRLSLRKGVMKLCRHPVFQLNNYKHAKKTSDLEILNSS